MKFIGQHRIWNELGFLIPELQEGRNFNLIFRAPSGWGKTKLAVAVALMSAKSEDEIEYILPDNNGEVDLDLTKRFIVIDEVHCLTQPENLYPLMDSGKYTFILCSNESGQLKEPLVNRCFDFNFDNYSTVEIGAIILNDLITYGIQVETECLRLIADNCNSNPRVARKITERIAIIYKGKNIDDIEELKSTLSNTLQIEDGLNPLHRRYLDYLKKQGRASLDSISFATRLDKQTILKEVEPVLIFRGLIKISSKGRQLNVSL